MYYMLILFCCRITCNCKKTMVLFKMIRLKTKLLFSKFLYSRISKIFIWVWRSLVARLNGVQEAGSSNLPTQTIMKAKRRTNFIVLRFYLLAIKRFITIFLNRFDIFISICQSISLVFSKTWE